MNRGDTFIIGMFAGTLIFGLALMAFHDDSELHRKAESEIAKCEAELPRSQYCKLIAIPEEEK